MTVEKDLKKTTTTTTKGRKTTTKASTSKAPIKEEVKKEITIDEDLVKKLLNKIDTLEKEIEDSKVEKETTDKKVEEKPKTINKKATFKEIRNEEFAVQRVLDGIGDVFYKDKITGYEFTWKEKGDIEYIQGEILKRMNNSPLFLKTPWLKIIDNDEIVDLFGLRQLYDDIELIEDVDKVLKLSDSQLGDIVNRLPKEYKQVLGTNIASNITNGTLNDINIIRKFERLLKKQFV